MNFALILIGTRPWSQSVHGVCRFLSHAILNICLRLLRTVKTWARLSLHLEGIDMGLAASCVLRASISEVSILVLTRTGMLDFFTFETVILWQRPKRCLLLVFSRRGVNIWPGNVTQAFVIDEMSN